MAFDEKTKRVFVEITEARILEEVKQLGVSTSTDILIKAANLAVEGLIGRISKRTTETSQKPLKRFKRMSMKYWRTQGRWLPSSIWQTNTRNWNRIWKSDGGGASSDNRERGRQCACSFPCFWASLNSCWKPPKRGGVVQSLYLVYTQQNKNS